jgi:hypothetical protein
MKNILVTAFSIAVFGIVGFPQVYAATVSDNFSDLNDTANPTWTHLSGDANSTGQTWDASTGEYHLIAPSNGIVIGGVQYAVAGGYTGASSTDVFVKADLTQPGTSSGVAWGVAARLDGNNAFNGLKGYGYFFEQNLSAAPGVGEMVMQKISGLSIGDMGNDGPALRLVTLDPNKDYTLALTIVGSLLTGTVTEVGGPVVAFQSKTDASFTSGFSGVFGFGGKLTTGALTDYQLNYTIDNFLAADIPEPASMLLAASGIGAVMLIRRRRLHR